MRAQLLTIILVILMAAVAAAQDEEGLRELVDGPTGILLTEGERAQLDDLSGAEAINHFIELFWLRRDPDLSSRENELQVEVEARALAADNEFGEPGLRGALTARGRVLILLGVPSRHAQMPIKDYLAQLYKVPPPEVLASDPKATANVSGVTFNVAKGTADLWAYSRDSLPPRLQPPGDDEEVIFAFFDSLGSGKFHLQGGIRKAQGADKLLERAPAALLLHPDLDEAPVYSLQAGLQAATAEQLAIFDDLEPRWPEGAALTAAQGVSRGDELPLWIHVVLPGGESVADSVAGRILLEDGTVLGSFQQETSGHDVAQGTAYTLSLAAPEGPSILHIALFAGAEAVAVRRVDLELSEAGPEFLSAVFAGAEVAEARDSRAGDPFVFGGYRLTPRPGGEYATGESLNLFCLVARPGLNPDGSTDATVRMRWYVDGKPAPSAAPQAVNLAPAGEEIYVWGTQLPLAALSAGNEYTLRIKVADKLSGSSRTTEIPIRIID